MKTLLDRTKDELDKEGNHWSRRVVVINVYHHYKLNINPRWTYADTGRDLKVSKAFVSEAIKLANSIVKMPELINLSRKKAISMVRTNA